jgi:hypothetical protein
MAEMLPAQPVITNNPSDLRALAPVVPVMSWHIIRSKGQSAGSQ